MSSFMEHLVGPRVPLEELRNNKWRYVTPSVLLVIARVLILVSIFVPYWHMELEAPQYPNGLSVTAYVNHLEGDVKEINGLNHYIGMRPLEQAAKFERASAVWALIAMILLMEGAAFVHSRWAVLLALPALAFPGVFLLDLQFWLHTFGQNLDPGAPLSASVKPFTPTILGEGGIGQFKTYATAGPGLWLAIGGAAITLIAFYFHRRAYKPLVDRTIKSVADTSTACAA